MDVFKQNCCFREKVVVFDQFSGKVVVFGQKWFYSGKSGSIQAKWLYSGKVVVFRKCSCILGIVVVFGKEWLYSGKVAVFG